MILHDCCKTGKIEIVETQLKNPNNLFSTRDINLSLIHSRRKCHNDIFKLLLNNSRNFVFLQRSINRVLRISIQERNKEILKTILDNYRNFAFSPVISNLVLMSSVRRGATDIVQTLFDNSKHFIFSQDIIDKALLTSIKRGHKDVTQYFLKNSNNFTFSQDILDKAYRFSSKHGELDICKATSLYHINENMKLLGICSEEFLQFVNRLKTSIVHAKSIPDLRVNTVHNNIFVSMKVHDVFDKIIKKEKIEFDKSNFTKSSELIKLKELPAELSGYISTFGLVKPSQLLSNFQNKMESLALYEKMNTGKELRKPFVILSQR